MKDIADIITIVKHPIIGEKNMKDRKNVWLGVAGLVIQNGQWLLVKKTYGGLKGQWSLPAGFVEEDETMDEAAIREVEEETGIKTRIIGVYAIRSGVIKEMISDNMVVFLMEPIGGEIKPQEKEIAEVIFMKPKDILQDENTSKMLHAFIKNESEKFHITDTINPGDQFGYTSYKLIQWNLKNYD